MSNTITPDSELECWRREPAPVEYRPDDYLDLMRELGDLVPDPSISRKVSSNPSVDEK